MFLIGRSVSEGMTLAAAAVVAMVFVFSFCSRIYCLYVYSSVLESCLCRKLESARVLNVNVSEEKQECPVGSECLFM